MALSDRDIIITPNRGASSEPIITLRGADAASSASMVMRVINSGTVSTLSFEGTSGQLFAVSDTFAGTIFSVNDVSGIPSIEVIDNGDIKLAEWNGKVRVGGANNNENAISTTTGELQVVGGVGVSRDVYVGGAMTVVGTLNAAVVAGSITNAANVGITNDTGSGAAQYITFVSGTSGNLPLKVDGSELVFVPSTGRIGIGNAAPAYKLDVTGEAQVQNYLRITNTGGAQSLLMGNQDSAGVNNPSIIVAANGTIFFGNGNSWAGSGGTYTYRANISSTGLFLGTGTTSATHPLTIVNASPIMSIGNSANQGGAIYFGNSAHGVQRIGTGNDVSLYTTSGNVYLSASGVATTSHVALLNNGNVGIGDADPTQKLVVAGSAVITGGVYGAETGAPDARIWAVSPANPTWGIFYNEGTPDYIEFQTAGTVSSRIALDSGEAHFGLSGGGRVGIGTGTPNTRLHIFQDGLANNTVNPLITLDGKFNVVTVDSNDIVAIASRVENNAGGSQTTNIIGSGFQTTYNSLLLQPSGGNVGINNTNPGRPLDVTGVANVTSHITQGPLISRPNVAWGATSGTGAVIIKLPGGTGNYGMIHAVIDIYTYDGENASTIIIGGHNWNSAWYNFGATRIGAFSKGVRVGFKDGQYCIVLGTNTSTWSYGQVVVRKIQNGSYYSGIMDLGGTYSIALDAAAESYTYISSNLITTGSAGGGGWNSGNDGSGSGLDADLIDGLDSTAFLRRDVTNTMFAGQTSSLAFENQSTFFRFAFNELRFYDNQNGDIFGLNEHAYATTSMRAPIFYDRDDTAYYVNPNSESRLWYTSVNVGQETTGGANSSNAGLVLRGNYNSNTWAHKFHKFDNGGGVPLYLSKTVGTGVWTAVQGWGSGLPYDSQVFGSFEASTAVYSPLFYDSNNTAFYLDPNSTTISLNMAGSVRAATYNRPGILTVASGTASTGGSFGIQQETAEGWTGIFVDYEPNTGWGLWHDNPNNYFCFTSEAATGSIRSFAVPSRVSGNRTAHEKFRVDQNNGDIIVGRDGYANASFRAPIFYDSNNTAFYTDPASTSVLNNLTVTGTTNLGTIVSSGNNVLTTNLNSTSGDRGWDLHGNLAMQAIYGNHSPLNNGNVYNTALFRGSSWTMYGFNGSSWVNLGTVPNLTNGYGKANFGGVTLSRAYSQFIIDCGASFGYTFMSAFTLTHSTSGNSMNVYFEKSTSATYNSGTWSVMGEALGVGSWPGGTSVKFSDVVGGGYPAYARLRIIPTWSHPSNDISLGQFFVSAAYGGGNQLLSWDSSYNVTASGSFRSPIFYDSDDTTYYVNPASDTRLGAQVKISGNASGSTGNALIVGSTTVNFSLQDTNVRPIIQAHGQYPVLSLNHTVTSNGSHGPTVQFTANGTGNQFVIGMNGNGSRLDIGTATGNSWNPHNGIDNYLGITGWRMDTSGNVNHLISTRSPIYYDYNNTAYYTDQAGTSNYFNLQITGASNKYLYLNPGNGYEAMVRYNGGSGSGWYVGKRVASQVVGTESFHFYSEAAGQTVGGIDTNGNIFARDSVRAPIFYDNNNTAFYTDPASTSVLNNLTVSGTFNYTGTPASGFTLPCNIATGRSAYGRANANLVLLADSTYGAACIDFRSGVNYPSDGAQIYYETATNGASGEISRLVLRTENDANDSILLRGGFIQYQSITVDGGSSNPGHIFTYNSTDRMYVYSDNTTETGSFRAPIFYDSNNTGYYVDPNGTTNIWTLFHNAGTAYFRGGQGVDQCCGDDGAVSIGGNATKPPRIAWHSGGIMEGTMEGSGTGWRKIYFYDQQGAGLGVHATGQIASNVEVVAYYSDRRLKEDLERVTDHWNVINNITGYRYTWNEKSGEIPGFIEKVGKREVGLIAQDVLAVYPEAVYTRQEGPTDDPYKTIMHDRFSAVFIEALKDLKKEVDQLKQENKELRDMLNARPTSD